MRFLRFSLMRSIRSIYGAEWMVLIEPTSARG